MRQRREPIDHDAATLQPRALPIARMRQAIERNQELKPQAR
jgi:hypothetical protein